LQGELLMAGGASPPGTAGAAAAAAIAVIAAGIAAVTIPVVLSSSLSGTGKPAHQALQLFTMAMGAAYGFRPAHNQSFKIFFTFKAMKFIYGHLATSSSKSENFFCLWLYYFTPPGPLCKTV
jgi:hypothetical protein